MRKKLPPPPWSLPPELTFGERLVGGQELSEGVLEGLEDENGVIMDCTGSIPRRKHLCLCL